MSLLQSPGAGHGQALLLKLVGTNDEVLARLAGFCILRWRGRHRHVTGIVLKVGELWRRYVLDVMSLSGLGLQFTANVVRHLTILLAFLRAAVVLVIAFVALIINPGENEHV